MNPQDIIITGAGASAAEKLPIQSMIFQEFWKSHQRDLRNILNDQMLPKKENNPWGEVLLNLDYYLKIFFGIDLVNQKSISKTQFPTFEEALGVLDFALSNREEFWDFPEDLIRETHFNHVALIAACLQDSMPKTNYHHLNLIKSLKKHERLNSTAFITTNYDLMLDSAIIQEIGLDNTDFGVNFRSNHNEDSWIPNENPTKLLKLHGSLDWLYCACCKSIDRAPIDTVIPGRSEGTPFCKCGNVKKPVIVPPSFIKELSNYYIQQLWMEAEKIIENAKRIIFCGYSLPDADLNIKYLLKRAQVKRMITNEGLRPNPKGQLVKVEQKFKEIYIINYHQKKTKKAAKEEYERFKRFFGAKVKIINCDFGFETYAKNPTIIDSM